MKNNICVIHNGNLNFLKSVQDKYVLQKYPCFVADWDTGKTINQKLSFLKNSKIIFDISTADNIDYEVLMEIKKTTSIIKLLTPYEVDALDVSAIWKNTLTKELYYFATSKYMTFSDEIISYLPKITGNCPIIFSPGRCGTHILKSILRKDFPNIKHMHHDVNISFFLDKKIFIIIRKNIRDYILSKLK